MELYSKKMINGTEHIEEEMISGFVKAYNTCVEKVPSINAVVTKKKSKRVKIVVSGGIGCEPLYLGYVGENMADGVCLGHIFASPSAYSIYETVKYMGCDDGVVFIYGNYSGDFLNHDMASELLRDDGIQSHSIIVKDDIASENILNKDKRSGIAGIMWTIKIAAAAANKGYSLEEVCRIAQKAADNLYSLPVVLDAGTSPKTGEKLFEVKKDKIEIGMGFNGEPGISSIDISSAKNVMDIVFDHINDEIVLDKNDEVCILLNNAGNMTFLEMYILYNRLFDRIQSTKAKIHDTDIGRYICPQDMLGFSVTILKLDDELKQYYNMSAITPGYKKI